MQEALDRISSPIKRKKQNKKKVKSEKFFEQLKFGLREPLFLRRVWLFISGQLGTQNPPASIS
jgi:hypothetical protein